MLGIFCEKFIMHNFSLDSPFHILFILAAVADPTNPSKPSAPHQDPQHPLYIFGLLHIFCNTLNTPKDPDQTI